MKQEHEVRFLSTDVSNTLALMASYFQSSEIASHLNEGSVNDANDGIF